MSDTRAVRENLEWERLAAYLREHLGTRGDMRVEQFAGGHSNLTYVVAFDDRELVIRRPPFGPVPPRAHDMAREYRVLEAVHPHFPLAPQPLLLCEDASILGSVFYAMERRHGLVIREDEPEAVKGNVALRGAMSASVVDTLADLHAIPVAGTSLETLVKGSGFVPRQIRGWTERWNGSKTEEVPEMDALAAWLESRVPVDPQAMSLVHGDYKLDNIMFDPADPRRVSAVFDWEMSAIGDPLVDVGIILCYWVHAAAGAGAMPDVTRREGWFGREEILERYASRSGRSLEGIELYEVFALFKLVVIIQQIYARYVRGQTDDPRFRDLGIYVKKVARLASHRASA